MSAARPAPLRRAIVLAASAVGFGVLWGVAQALWLLAPWLVAQHRLVPASPEQWLVLDGVLVAMSALIAAVLGFVVAAAVLWWQQRRREPFRCASWVLALAPAAALPVVYLALVALGEAVFFGRMVPVADVALIGVWSAIAFVAVRWLYALAASRSECPSTKPVAVALAATIAIALAVLPLRIPAMPAAHDDVRSLGERAGPGRRPAVLLIGLDSGNWTTMQPLLDQGRLPTFARLVATGMRGTVEALWPPFWSGTAWASIVTGHPRDETGIFGDLMVDVPGLPPVAVPLDRPPLLDPFRYVEWRLLRSGVVALVHPPRSALGRRPVWELLHDAGVDASVVRFYFADPPEGQGSVVVASRLGKDAWDFPVRQPEATAVAGPGDLAAELVSIFSVDTPADADVFRRVAQTTAEPPGDHGKLEMKMLRTTTDIDNRTLEAARLIVRRRPKTEFLGVFLGGFDGVCHAFWPYRFPEAYGAAAPAPELVATFGGILDRYLEFLDAGLADLLREFPDGVNVVIVADHGHMAATNVPVWRAWHAREGLFLAAGPSIPHRDTPVAVSYFDVVPTVLDLLGFPIPEQLHGRSVLRP